MVKFSRSGVEKFLSCKRCFVLYYKHKIYPPSLPFTLNSAVDNLCKNEFDYYRQREEPHPLFLEHGIKVLTMGHRTENPDALFNFYIEVSKYEYISSETFFTAIFYGLFMKKNVSFMVSL